MYWIDDPNSNMSGFDEDGRHPLCGMVRHPEPREKRLGEVLFRSASFLVYFSLSVEHLAYIFSKVALFFQNVSSARTETPSGPWLRTVTWKRASREQGSVTFVGLTEESRESGCDGDGAGTIFRALM